jgi:hypothetical protein
MSLISLAPVDRNTIPTPPSGYVNMFFDSLDNTLLKYKTHTGSFVTVGGNSGTGGNSNYMITNTLSDRNSIQPEVRLDGLLVYVKDTTGVSNAKKPKIYQLQGGITNSEWVCLDQIKEDHIVTTAGQTTFTMNSIQDPDKNIKVFIGGLYLEEKYYTLVGTLFTWGLAGVDLEVGEVLTFFIKE